MNVNRPFIIEFAKYQASGGAYVFGGKGDAQIKVLTKLKNKKSKT